MKKVSDESVIVGRSRKKNPYSEKKESMGQSRKRKNKISPVVYFFAVPVIFFMLVYATYSLRFRNRFFPNTYVNGINASGKTVPEVKKEMEAIVHSYILDIAFREDIHHTISASQMGLTYMPDAALDRYVQSQNMFFWIAGIGMRTDITINMPVDIDEAKLSTTLSELHEFDPEWMRSPRDAYISEYESGKGYSVIPADPGTQIDKEKALEVIKKTALLLEKKVNLDEEQYALYTSPVINVQDDALKSRVDLLNKYISASLHYDDGTVLEGEQIQEWLDPNAEEDSIIDYTQIEDFVSKLSKSYNTVYKPKVFHTHEGADIMIAGGNYGWKVNQATEAMLIQSMIMEGKKEEGRKPAFFKTAAAFGEKDYGDTYIEVNLSKQKMYFYKQGELSIESDIVSGDESKDYLTPAGVFDIAYKQENAELKGEDYETKVEKWMPFNGNIGFHDAAWREKFGGEIYKTSGSHGCINMPPDKARLLYENIETGTPVICYYEDGKTIQIIKPLSGAEESE